MPPADQLTPFSVVKCILFPHFEIMPTPLHQNPVHAPVVSPTLVLTPEIEFLTPKTPHNMYHM